LAAVLEVKEVVTTTTWSKEESSMKMLVVQKFDECINEGYEIL